MKKNIVEIFFDSAKKHASKTAIVHQKEMVSYGVLAKKVEAMAVFLSEKGIQKGDKILVFIPMSIQLYTTILALFSIGAMVVFVDEWSRKSRLENAIQIVDIDTIIAPRRLIWLAYLVPRFRKIKRKFSIPKNIRSSDYNYVTVKKNDTALITFTTGSTGLPKAANRTHQFLWEQFRILKSEIGASENDHCLITLPIVLLSILGTGATGYIVDFNQKKPHKLNVKKQVTFAQKHKISLLIASPFFIEALAKAGQNNIPTLRRIFTGGAPVFPGLAELIQSSFPTSKNIIAYGSTEAEPISTLTMKALLASYADLSKGLCVGAIHPEVSCRIIKIMDQAITVNESDWSDLEVGAGILGEIIVTGPHVLDKYYNSEKSFKENKIIDGGVIWHRTGDSGILKDGMLYLHGRCVQLINISERTLSPFIIENQLQEIEGVQLGTLIHHDHQLIACVELKKGFSQQGIENGLKRRKIPFDKLEILESIPRDARHFSKIEYGELRKKLVSQYANKNKKNIVKRVLGFWLILLGILLTAIFLMVLFSPYGNQEGRARKLVERKILIKAPVEQVFAYLGNSDNASEWSVFVDHISPLNSYEVSDGNPGSIRRCFVEKDESEQSWDEEVLAVDLNKRRLLSCYNYNNFILTAGMLNTEQLYKATKGGHCLLSLTLFFPQKKTTLLKHLKMYYAAYQVAYLFEENLKNIKQFNEDENQ